MRDAPRTTAVICTESTEHFRGVTSNFSLNHLLLCRWLHLLPVWPYVSCFTFLVPLYLKLLCFTFFSASFTRHFCPQVLPPSTSMHFLSFFYFLLLRIPQLICCNFSVCVYRLIPQQCNISCSYTGLCVCVCVQFVCRFDAYGFTCSVVQICTNCNMSHLIKHWRPR